MSNAKMSPTSTTTSGQRPSHLASSSRAQKPHPVHSHRALPTYQRIEYDFSDDGELDHATAAAAASRSSNDPTRTGSAETYSDVPNIPTTDLHHDHRAFFCTCRQNTAGAPALVKIIPNSSWAQAVQELGDNAFPEEEEWDRFREQFREHLLSDPTFGFENSSLSNDEDEVLVEVAEDKAQHEKESDDTGYVHVCITSSRR
ncbi:hypothetical protein R3P38DRAFT_2838212 [Favolaschia claudopus]|uniref:Uncharacterized protein n=1 Tax=Favolaschia claudopus TaxID=2862362 RepID=A0AAW0E7M9_9AGAR